MKLERQSKMRVLIVSVFFSWSCVILPGLARHALAEDQSAQSEEVIVLSETTNTDIQLTTDQKVESEEVTEQPQGPIVTANTKDQAQLSREQPTRSDESGQTSSAGLSDTTKAILLGCLLFCNPAGPFIVFYLLITVATRSR